MKKKKGRGLVWSEIPEPYREMGSIEFSKFLIRETQVAVSPGIGFGGLGDGHVRFALVENEHRTRQALRSLRTVFQEKTHKRAAS